MQYLVKMIFPTLVMTLSLPFCADDAMAAKKEKKGVYLASASRSNQGPKNFSKGGESEKNRDGKTFQVTGTLLGVGLGSISGITTGLFLNENLMLTLRAEQHIFQFDFLGLDLYSTHSRLYGVGAKKFFGNSFYLDGALLTGFSESRQTQYRYQSGIGSYEARTYEKWQHSGVQLAIGNQWQWEYFTLGTDWIGYYAPLQKTRVEYDQDEGYEDLNSSSFSPGHLRILAFYLGASF